MRSLTFSIKAHVATSDILGKEIPETRFILTSPEWADEQGSKVRAMAALLDLQSVAHRLTSPGRDWKRKARYINQKYGYYATTKVLTAYITIV
ncbi:MAG: hypothetical protein AAB685_01170 [Patescibacteria group bacterium]